MTRDNAIWLVLLAGGAAAYVAGHFDKFPWIPTQYQGLVDLLGALAAIVGAKLGMSPLKLSDEGKVQVKAGVL